MKKGIETLDLQAHVAHATNDVFETMLSMDLETCDPEEAVSINGYHYVGSVSFTGEVIGVIRFTVSREFAREITAEMLGMETDEIESEEDVTDVVGEVSNMISGDIKSRLCDAGWDCTLSIPNVAKGTDFEIETKHCTRLEKCRFRRGDTPVFVELSIK